MRKFIILFLVIFSSIFLFSNEIQQPVKKLKAINTIKGKPPTRSRPVPEYEFLIEPADLMTTYYDYMPGSYNGIPICIQPEISQPGGYEAGGVYIVFHAKETTDSYRRMYWSYINSEGIVVNTDQIDINDIWAGYGGIDIDPVTVNPFVVWHQNDGSFYGVYMSYDLFHFNGEPGNWVDPFPVIDNTFPSPNPDDEFLWPYIQIGPSPTPDNRRIYVYASNAADNTPSGNPCENIVLAYADFETSDLDAQLDLEWTYQTIPLLDQWHNEEPWIRPFLSMAVSDDGKIAFIGWNTEDEIFVFLNENYGDGGFDFYSEDYRFFVENPFPEDPYDLYFTFANYNHFNTIFTEDNNKICFEGTMGLHGEDPDGGYDVYYPFYIYPKVFTFDLMSDEFSFYDLYPQGANPNDDIPMLPWDLDEDGIPDSIDENGNIVPVQGWPFYYYDNGMGYHENYYHIVKNEEFGWLAAVWSDGLKAKLANDGEPGYEDWLEVPEIAICISNNNGETWSEPIFLNSLETPELADMIPCYIYPGDLIEDIGNEHGKLHLFFLDDYSYGSSIQGFGLQNGGMLKYAALDIDFGYDAAVDENEICSSELVLTSFPNPFSSETTISFNVTHTSRFVTLEIYNIKGQRVREFEIRNDKLEMNKVIWNGKDDAGKTLSSGIYYARINSDKGSIVKKITFIK